MQLVRFERRDTLLIAGAILLAVVSIAVGVRYFADAFPEASIDFKVTREQSLDTALTFLGTHGLAKGSLGATHAAAFDYDDTAKVFLERNFPLAEANRYMAGDIRLWRWGHRWFTPLSVEEHSVEVTTTGAVVSWSHELPEDAPGGHLDAAAARAIADRFAAATLRHEPGAWEFLDAKSERHPKRTDHVFTWKRTGLAALEKLDASYRADVRVAGGRVAGFDEYLHVPEAWKREYRALRAQNETAGTVASGFFFLTMIAVVAVFLMALRRGSVPWKIAAAFGVVGFLLQLGMGLNTIPLQLYHYDTTSSFASFAGLAVLFAFLEACGLGVLIFLLTAGGEPEYRRQYGHLLSLPGQFSRSGVRTKTFFLSMVIGLTMTCFFFAYQAVFYVISARLGAWSPQEINYSELLNTRFPWIAVLLIGFMPAVTEEFMSRMFSVPFLERFVRWRWVAVLVASLIWGFGHAAYPNQPWYIRGLEVGLAGVAVCWVMLRWGILATLVWHYTVDALYTGFVLLRSDNLYFQATAAAGIGVAFVPLIWSLVAYMRHGGFVAEEPLRNAAMPKPETPPPVARTLATPPAYVALGKRDWVLAGVIVAAAVAALLVPHAAIDDGLEIAVPATTARQVADTRLRSLGADPAKWRVAVTAVSEIDELEAKYLLTQRGSMEKAASVYRNELAAALWRVRYFQPGEKEEWRVRVDAAHQRIVAEEHMLDEDAPGADLSEAQARALAETYLRGAGIDTTARTLKESKSTKRPHRRDWTFSWEDAERFRHTVVVAGDRVTAHRRDVHVPEAFERERDEQDVTATALFVARLAAIVVVLGGLVMLLIGEIRRGTFPLRRALLAGALATIVMLAASANGYTRLLAQYPTDTPWNLYLIALCVGLPLVAMLAGIGVMLLYGLTAALYPGRALPLSGHRGDALVAALAAAAAWTLVGTLRDIAWSALPAVALPGGPADQETLHMLSPFAALVLAWMLRLTFAATLAGALAYLWEHLLIRPWQRLAAGALFTLALVPGSAHTLAEYGAGLFFAALTVTATMWVMTRFWRGNALAYVAGFGLALALRLALPLLAQPQTGIRVQASLALATMLAILGAVLWRASRSPLAAPHLVAPPE